MLSWAIYGAKLILNLDLSSKGWTGLKPKVVQIAPFKCSTGITDIWLIAQVEFKSWTTNWTPSQDFCLEVAPDPRVVRLCPQHIPGSCWDDAVGGRRAEAFGTYKILIENSVVWASSSVDLTSGILLNTFPFEDKACNNFWFFPLWVKFQCQNAKGCRALKGLGGKQTFKYQWDAAGSRALSLSAYPSAPGSSFQQDLWVCRVQICQDAHYSWGRGRLLSLGCFHELSEVAWMCQWLHCSSDTVKIPKSLQWVGTQREIYL